ncbi:MAG: hypothetical protein Q8L65_04275, partial [Burkholderiales bacterium]|nr:hypothetical protein [Burkholderiales bacterium]
SNPFQAIDEMEISFSESYRLLTAGGAAEFSPWSCQSASSLHQNASTVPDDIDTPHLTFGSFFSHALDKSNPYLQLALGKTSKDQIKEQETALRKCI